MKTRIFALVGLVAATCLVLVSCNSKPSMEQVITYLKIGANAYQACGTIVMTTLQDTDPQKYAKFCETNEEVKKFWNLGIDGLQAYMENKGVGTDAIVINLTSAKVAMRKIFEVAGVDPKIRVYIEASISAVQAVTIVLLPDVEFTETQAVDLSECKLTLTCPEDKITVKSVVPYKDTLQQLLSTESTLTPEMETLKKSLEN